MNKELEEAAEHNYPYDDVWIGEEALIRRLAFVKGAKWQQKRMYSEKEVLDILYKHTEDLLAGKKVTLEEWFEQFKKK